MGSGLDACVRQKSISCCSGVEPASPIHDPRLPSGTSGSAAAVTGNNRASHLQATRISVGKVAHGDRPRKLTRAEVALFTLLVILLSVLVHVDSSRSTSGVPILEASAVGPNETRPKECRHDHLVHHGSVERLG